MLCELQGKLTAVGQKVRVSVVIPVRNGGEYIEEALLSLYSQSFQDFEVIVVDNGSTDNTRQVCTRVFDSRSRLLSNSGRASIAESLNLGMEHSRGDYIARLDSDDMARPDRLGLQVEFLDRNPEVGIVGSWVRTFGERNSIWKYPVASGDIRLSMFYRSPFAHPAVMFRRLWPNGKCVRYDPVYDYSEDLELWTRFCLCGPTANIPEPLTLYRTHSSQATRTNLPERERLVRQIVTKYSDEIGILSPEAPATFGRAVVWWDNILNASHGAAFFEGAHIKARRREHLFLLARAFVRRALQGLTEAKGSK